jgi:putative tributyrin esterase
MALLHCQFHSEALQIAASMDVILPQAACMEGSGPLPVLYLLHGLSDDHTIWQRRTSIERYVDLLRLAVVMPAVNRSFYADMAHGARYWAFISQEVPAVAQAFFPISSERSDCFVAGLSMGGFGAFKLALNLPNRFAAAASLSGALDMVSRADSTEATREQEDCFGDPRQLVGSENDLLHVASALTHVKQVPRLYQWCGREDFLYGDNIRFRDHVRKLGLDLTYEEGPGGHEWACWDQQIQRVLQWLPLPARREIADD